MASFCCFWVHHTWRNNWCFLKLIWNLVQMELCRSPARPVKLNVQDPEFIAWEDIHGIDIVKDEIEVGQDSTQFKEKFLNILLLLIILLSFKVKSLLQFRSVKETTISPITLLACLQKEPWNWVYTDITSEITERKKFFWPFRRLWIIWKTRHCYVWEALQELEECFWQGFQGPVCDCLISFLLIWDAQRV